MDIKNILSFIGERSSEGSAYLFNKFSEFIGADPSSLSVKILTLIILSSALLLSLKISQKVVKIILLILIPILVISIVYSIFA